MKPWLPVAGAMAGPVPLATWARLLHVRHWSAYAPPMPLNHGKRGIPEVPVAGDELAIRAARAMILGTLH
jgi:hypothetical protein